MFNIWIAHEEILLKMSWADLHCISKYWLFQCILLMRIIVASDFPRSRKISGILEAQGLTSFRNLRWTWDPWVSWEPLGFSVIIPTKGSPQNRFLEEKNLGFCPNRLGHKWPNMAKMVIYGHLATGPCATNMGKQGIPEKNFKNIA